MSRIPRLQKRKKVAVPPEEAEEASHFERNDRVSALNISANDPFVKTTTMSRRSYRLYKRAMTKNRPY